MPNAPKILMVVTSHGDIDEKPTTGIWFTEFSEPFATFIKSGVSVLSHEFARLCLDNLAKIESAVAVQTNGFACSL